MDEKAQQTNQVEPPLGMYSAKIDEKGRIKLPADFQQYFSGRGETRFFLTSLDRRIARLYTVPVWRQNEKFLAGNQGDSKKRRWAAFNAAELGGVSELDGQGRVLLPAELRAALGMENQSVRLFVRGEHVQILSEKIFEERRRESEQITTEDVGELEDAGLA